MRQGDKDRGNRRAIYLFFRRQVLASRVLKMQIYDQEYVSRENLGKHDARIELGLWYRRHVNDECLHAYCIQLPA